MLTSDLPYFNDREGEGVPEGISRVWDTHVHVFPDAVFSAVRNWFDVHAWRIRYRMTSKELIAFLLDHGIGRVTALQYAHKPGMADYLNSYMADLCETFPGQVMGLATFFPGEEGAVDILNRAFDQGLCGVKLHTHVQCFDMNSTDLDPVYGLCQDRGRPMVIHAGREPKSDHYACDPYEICKASKVEKILKTYPGLKFCVPHLGFDEIKTYRRLIEEYDTLWLDTAMVVTDYFPDGNPDNFGEYRLDRIMYGSDYPNIPYAWDRELVWLSQAGLSEKALDHVLYANACTFYGEGNAPD